VVQEIAPYICAINNKNNKTMTHTIEVSKGFEVVVNIYNDCVITTVNYLGTTRKNSYESIQDLINNTTIGKVAEFLKSI
jgi:hypothetical protein